VYLFSLDLPPEERCKAGNVFIMGAATGGSSKLPEGILE
jgi:hypothetical protein